MKIIRTTKSSKVDASVGDPHYEWNYEDEEDLSHLVSKKVDASIDPVKPPEWNYEDFPEDISRLVDPDGYIDSIGASIDPVKPPEWNYENIPEDISRLVDPDGYIDTIEANISTEPEFGVPVVSNSMSASDFFNKEEFVELVEAACEELDNLYNDIFEILDLWIEGNLLHVELEAQDEPLWVSSELIIDMRRIKSPNDLMKYKNQLVQVVSKEIDQQTNDYNTVMNTPDIDTPVDSAYVPEPSLDPPESDPYNVEEDIDDYIEFDLNIDIIIDSDGSIEDTDPHASFAGNPDNKKGEWYSYEHDILLDDKDTVAENLYEVIFAKYNDLVPTQPGRYKMTGSVMLAYVISGIESQGTPYQETDGMGDYTTEVDTEYFTDNAEAEFVIGNSEIKNLTFTPVR